MATLFPIVGFVFGKICVQTIYLFMLFISLNVMQRIIDCEIYVIVLWFVSLLQVFKQWTMPEDDEWHFFQTAAQMLFLKE